MASTPFTLATFKTLCIKNKEERDIKIKAVMDRFYHKLTQDCSFLSTLETTILNGSNSVIMDTKEMSAELCLIFEEIKGFKLVDRYVYANSDDKDTIWSFCFYESSFGVYFTEVLS